tara:strand:- start:1864 stop:2088 length:225 start_codon:yes stop_codon:yes gene_type:complete
MVSGRNIRIRKRILDVMEIGETYTTREIWERLYYDERGTKRILGSVLQLSMVMSRTPGIQRMGKKRQEKRWRRD